MCYSHYSLPCYKSKNQIILEYNCSPKGYEMEKKMSCIPHLPGPLGRLHFTVYNK